MLYRLPPPLWDKCCDLIKFDKCCGTNAKRGKRDRVELFGPIKNDGCLEA